MKILVTFAVASEFAAWRRQHDFRQVAHEPFALYLSEMAGEADAVEMESFVILAEAARHGVRAAVIRSVSDTASCSLPYDFDQARDARGQIRMGALLRQVIRQPQRLPALLRFARDCRFAARQLADFLDRYLQLLSTRLDLSQSEMVAVT